MLKLYMATTFLFLQKKLLILKIKKKIITDGDTKAIVESKYIFDSKNVLFLIYRAKSSGGVSYLKDDDELEKFKYFVKKEIVKERRCLQANQKYKRRSNL